jgi:hypothetical protein
MGLLDRMKAAFGGGHDAGDEPVVLPVDMTARRGQLDDLEDALRSLARAMAADEARMANPGWRGRVADLRFAADQTGRLSRHGFDRAALYDLAAEVPLLYRAGTAPADFAPYHVAHERVVQAVEAIRAPLPSEISPTETWPPESPGP